MLFTSASILSSMCFPRSLSSSGSTSSLQGTSSPASIIPFATGNEQGRFYGVDNGSRVFVLFRLYLDETGVGASYYELINDRVIVFHKK